MCHSFMCLFGVEQPNIMLPEDVAVRAHSPPTSGGAGGFRGRLRMVVSAGRSRGPIPAELYYRGSIVTHGTPFQRLGKTREALVVEDLRVPPRGSR